MALPLTRARRPRSATGRPPPEYRVMRTFFRSVSPVFFERDFRNFSGLKTYGLGRAGHCATADARLDHGNGEALAEGFGAGLVAAARPSVGTRCRCSWRCCCLGNLPWADGFLALYSTVSDLPGPRSAAFGGRLVVAWKASGSLSFHDDAVWPWPSRDVEEHGDAFKVAISPNSTGWGGAFA